MQNNLLQTPDKLSLVNDIFSSKAFAGVDASRILSLFDRSDEQLEFNKAMKLSATTPTPLTTNTFSEIPANGWLIDQPGTYTMTANCSWSPNETGYAITIAAPNVQLNLGGNTLTINIPEGTTTQTYNGITVEPGDTSLPNAGTSVTIYNGTISGANFYSIEANMIEGLILSQLTITNMSYTNTQQSYIAAAGIFLGVCANFNINTCTISNINVNAPSCAGIQTIACWEGVVSNCQIYNLTNQDGSTQGYSYIFSWDIGTFNCSCSGLTTNNLGVTVTTGHTSIGFVPTFSQNLVFGYCSSNNITGCCDDAHGMSLFLVKNVLVNAFTADGVTDGPAPYKTGAKATGLEVYGNYISIYNSQVSNIHATVPQDLQAAGFSAWGDTIQFNGCTASNVQVLSAAGTPDTSYGYGTGYGWAPDPRKAFNSTVAGNVQYINCTSNQCQLGFDTWNHVNSAWVNFTATSCGQFNLNLQAGVTRSLSMNKCSEQPSDEPSPVTITNQAANNTVPQG